MSPSSPPANTQTVTSVTHWTDRLFSFRITRPESLRFRSGEFVMLGLPGDEKQEVEKPKPLKRAYSIASPSWDDELEFYSIKVPDGPFTSKLQHIKIGEQITLQSKPVGTLVLDALLSGNRLWLFATGTGIAPFASILQDPETYHRYDQIIVTHTCREVAELAYGGALIEKLRSDETLQELIGKANLQKVTYYPNTTRERSGRMGRITTLLRDGTVFKDLGLPVMSPDTDRAMICGSKTFNLEIKGLLEKHGLEEGANSNPKHFVVEKAFVE